MKKETLQEQLDQEVDKHNELAMKINQQREETRVLETQLLVTQGRVSILQEQLMEDDE